MGRILRYIWTLYKFARASQEFLRSNYRVIELQDASTAAALKRSCRTIVSVSVVSVVVGLLVVPLGTVLYGVLHYGWSAQDAFGRGLMGLIFSIIGSPAHLYFGVALGCLLSDRDFLESSIGTMWLHIIGVATAAQARVVCWLVVVVVFGLWLGLSALMVAMAPFD